MAEMQVRNLQLKTKLLVERTVDVLGSWNHQTLFSWRSKNNISHNISTPPRLLWSRAPTLSNLSCLEIRLHRKATISGGYKLIQETNKHYHPTEIHDQYSMRIAWTFDEHHPLESKTIKLPTILSADKHLHMEFKQNAPICNKRINTLKGKGITLLIVWLGQSNKGTTN